MNFSSFRGWTFDVIAEISGLTTLRRIAATASRAVAEHGYTSLGINGLPPPTEGADPRVVTESTPDGFRAFYIAQRFYLVDHIGAHGRRTRAPFRFSQAPYPRDDSPGRRRFMQALVAFDMREGLVVPIGRPENVPACVWLAGANPDVHDETLRAVQMIALFASSKAYALRQPAGDEPVARPLTPRERDVLQWISAGKTSWEISSISGRSESATNKIIADAMDKLNAVTRTQAVVNAIRTGEVEM